MSDILYAIYTISQLIIFVIALFLPSVPQTAIITFIVLSFISFWSLIKKEEQLATNLRRSNYDDYKIVNTRLIKVQRDNKK